MKVAGREVRPEGEGRRGWRGTEIRFIRSEVEQTGLSRSTASFLRIDR